MKLIISYNIEEVIGYSITLIIYRYMKLITIIVTRGEFFPNYSLLHALTRNSLHVFFHLSASLQRLEVILLCFQNRIGEPTSLFHKHPGPAACLLTCKISLMSNDNNISNNKHVQLV